MHMYHTRVSMIKFLNELFCYCQTITGFSLEQSTVVQSTTTFDTCPLINALYRAKRHSDCTNLKVIAIDQDENQIRTQKYHF